MGMYMNGRWATPGAREVDFSWDVVKLPEGPGGPANWQFWGAYVVNANTENPEAAWALVTALTSADIQAQVSELGANIPSRVSQDAIDAFLTFSPPENNQAFLDGLSENPATEAPLWNGDWPSYSAAMETAVAAVVTGDQTIEDFQANICTELNQHFDG
jgi:multiple sugar transport system substrate-binding protein